MSTYYLVNTVRFGSNLLKSGSLIDSNTRSVVDVVYAGGMLAPSSLNFITEVAAEVTAMWASGKPQGECDAAMLAGYIASTSDTTEQTIVENLSGRAWVPKVMCIGDSKTVSATYSGYRSQMFADLAKKGLCRFVGSKVSTRATGDYRLADLNHEGVAGQTIDTITARVRAAILAYDPDIIVAQGMANDIALGHSAATILQSFRTFVDTCKAAKPDVKVLLLKDHVWQSTTDTAWERWQHEIVRREASDGLVAMAEEYGGWDEGGVGWSEGFAVCTAADLASGGTHPSETAGIGYDKVGAQVAKDLNNYLGTRHPSLWVPRKPVGRTADKARFNASGEYINIPYSAAMCPGGGNFAFKLDVYPQNIPSDNLHHAVVCLGTTGTTGIEMCITDGGEVEVWVSSTSGELWTKSALVEVSNNYHVVVAGDATTKKVHVWVNGQYIGPSSAAASVWAVPAEATRIGAGVNPFSYPAYALIGGYEFTKTFPTHEAVLASYYEGTLLPDAACRYLLEEGTGTTVYDHLGNCPDGTVTNADWASAAYDNTLDETSGTVTLNETTPVVVKCRQIQTGQVPKLTRITVSGGTGLAPVVAVTAGAGFTVTGAAVSDKDTYAWTL